MSILDDLRSGAFDRIGDGEKPEMAIPDRIVRASFLRFLLLGGEDGCRPHEKGVQLKGAWIVGALDLEGCRVPRGIALRNCHLEGIPILRGAIVDNLLLDGSDLPGLQAEGLETRGSVSLTGANVLGEVFMPGCRLGGNLNADRATIASTDGRSIAADAIIARGVLLRGARLQGGITLEGARLSADFNAAGIDLDQPDGIAISADSIAVDGDIILRAGHVRGAVRLIGAHVAGDINCAGAVLANPGRHALQLNRAVVRGGFFLRDGARIKGIADLTGASIGTLHDELDGWPDTGDLLLNRCLYDAFIDGDVAAKGRLDWLARQTPGRWGEDFWPQPYEQLADVMRRLGHEEDARAILIAKERLQRRARRKRATSPLWRSALTISDSILAITVLYGRQPLIAFVWLLLFWLVGVGVFGFSESQGAFKPSSAVILRSPEWTLCSVDAASERFSSATQQLAAGRAQPGQTQLDCFRSQFEAASYPAFNAWMYSLDTLFPVLEIDQKAYWKPDHAKPWGGMARFYFYIQSIVGWALSLLAVAGFSGLVKSR